MALVMGNSTKPRDLECSDREIIQKENATNDMLPNEHKPTRCNHPIGFYTGAYDAPTRVKRQSLRLGGKLYSQLNSGTRQSQAAVHQENPAALAFASARCHHMLGTGGT